MTCSWSKAPSTLGSRFDPIRDTARQAFETSSRDVQNDRDVQHFEANAAVVTPELASTVN